MHEQLRALVRNACGPVWTGRMALQQGLELGAGLLAQSCLLEGGDEAKPDIVDFRRELHGPAKVRNCPISASERALRIPAHPKGLGLLAAREGSGRGLDRALVLAALVESA
jgi:hypothetical protein